MDKKVDKIIRSIIRSRSNTFIRIENLISQQEIFDILDAADNILCYEPTVIRCPTHIRVVGDLHGNIDDLLRIFEDSGYPPKTKYLFLGDYVDRGTSSFEVAIMLLALKVKYPKHIFLIRGNHEIQHISEAYGFLEELKYKYSSVVFYAFHSVFVQLPFIALIGERIICLHGGIGPTMKKISSITPLSKPDEIADGTVFADIVWSDPRDQEEEFTRNSRGCGYYFNDKALEKFLDLNDLDLLIRSHELCNGCSFPYDKSDKCITVFSNTDYCGRKNDAAIIVVDGHDVSKRSILCLSNEEKKKWKPLYPEWLLEQKANTDSSEENDEPNSEIDLYKKESDIILSHSEIQAIVE